MQLLPLARNRPPVARSPGELQESLARAEKAVEALEKAFFAGKDQVYAAYCGRYYAVAAAYTLYWPLAQLTGANAAVVPAENLVYHLLAYRNEEPLVVYFSEPGCENMLIRVADAARHTGSAVIAVTPPLPPVIEDRARVGELLVVEETPFATTFVFLAAHLAARLLNEKGGIEVRRKRFVEELKTLIDVYDELVDKYGTEIEYLANETPSALFASPTMYPPAYLARMYYENEKKTLLEVSPLSSLLSLMQHVSELKKHLVVLTTTVEADLAREINYRVGLLGVASIRVLTIATDPLTAPLYGVLLVSRLFEEKQD